MNSFEEADMAVGRIPKLQGPWNFHDWYQALSAACKKLGLWRILTIKIVHPFLRNEERECEYQGRVETYK